MSSILVNAVELAVAERERQAKADSYFNDPVAWASYMLGISLWSKQREVAQSVMSNKSTAVKAGHGVGKALDLNTPIATTLGWKTIETLCIGDMVFDERGNPTPVVAKSEVFNMPMYEVMFSDGAVLRTNAPHEWVTLDHREAKKVRRRGPVADWRDQWYAGSVKETADITNSLTYVNGSNRHASNHIVPINRALKLPDADLPLDPYVVGAWLGDGTSVRAEMTIGADGQYIVDEFAKVGYTLQRTASGECRYTFARQGFVQVAKGMNLMHNKHIPSDYQRASEHQRWELLRGLMDTDGFVAHGNLCGIDLMNRELAYDTVELIRGLGMRASISPERTYLNGQDVGTRYRIVFNAMRSPFTRGQYKDRAFNRETPLTQTSRRTMRTVVSVREVGHGRSQCIQVGSDSHLFLAGEHLVPTHNSFLVAVLICHWIDTRYPHAFVASTAPSTAQINAIVWREVRRLKSTIDKRYKAGEIDHTLPGYITADAQWKTDDGSILGFGRKPPDNKEDDSFQGLHDAYVLAVGDEACGLNADLIDALGNITSNENSRRILIANPTNPASHFAKIFKEDTGAWSLHTISVLESPNFTDEKYDMTEEALASLTGPAYVEDKKKEYGEDSPRYKARVLGEFAFDDENTLINQETVEQAKACEIDPDPDGRPVLGVDVARMGKDKSAVYSNENGRIRYVDSWGKAPTTETANRVHRLAVDLGAEYVFVDSDGIGGGVKDQLVQLAQGLYAVVEVHGNARSPDNRQWHNFRAFAWDDFRSRCWQGLIDIDPGDEDLQDELMAPRYHFNKQSGGLVLESKEDMAKRGVRSPDLADAAVYASIRFDADDPLANYSRGDKIMQDPSDIIGEVPAYLQVMRTF